MAWVDDHSASCNLRTWSRGAATAKVRLPAGVPKSGVADFGHNRDASSYHASGLPDTGGRQEETRPKGAGSHLEACEGAS
jgi:hypothetical protein